MAPSSLDWLHKHVVVAVSITVSVASALGVIFGQYRTDDGSSRQLETSQGAINDSFS